jgi:hypothetical protein
MNWTLLLNNMENKIKYVALTFAWLGLFFGAGPGAIV